MLRRLLLGQPRRCEIKNKEISEEEKRIPDPLRKESNEKDLEVVHEAKDDIYDSDSETDGSETEDSDSETLDNSSRTDSYEDCSADVLEWKGFEVVRDAHRHGSPISTSKMIIETKGNPQGQNGGGKQSQENPFENAFDTQGNEMPHDEIKSEGTNSNHNDKHNNNNNNGSKESNTLYNKNDDEYDNKSNSTSSQTNNKQGNKTATATKTDTHSIASTSDKKTKDATESTTKSKNNQNEINNSRQKINIANNEKFDQPKMPLQLPKPSTTNQKPPNSKTKEISRNYSIRGNKNTSSTKRQTSSRINTEGKPLPSTRIPGKDPNVCKAQNSVIRHQDIGKDRTDFRGTRLGDKQKQANVNLSHISVSDLESVLGVNVTELREVIRKYKSEKVSTAEDSQGQKQVAERKVNSQGMVEDNLVDGKKSRRKNDEIKESKSGRIDNKDEISSDSGVSEPDAHSTDIQPHYITLKAIIKRKKYLEGQIKKLEDRIVVMGDHKKDIQFVHDLFDLHNDGLAKVERSNGGLACLANLKSILACQLCEIDEEEFRAKLKGLEDLGIPNFSEINARIEKLRKRIRHALDDERKCRSKGVQKLRFEIGKVQGMCEAVLDLVYTE